MYQYSKEQIKADKRHAAKLKHIVKGVTAAYLVWWALFQDKNKQYTQANDSNYPDYELVNELNEYATENGMNTKQPANNAELLEYATLLYTSVLAYKSIDYINKQLLKDKHYTAEIGAKMYKLVNNELADNIIDTTLKGVKWSDNIWANQSQLKNDLSTILRKSLLQSETTMSSVGLIRDKYNVYRYQSERILRTEGARVSAKQQANDIKQGGIDKAEWIASPGACSICSDLDGDIFPLKDFGSGKYVIPKHPNCRCAIAGAND